MNRVGVTLRRGFNICGQRRYAFLHSFMNVLRSLPCNFFSLACFEQSSDLAVRCLPVVVVGAGDLGAVAGALVAAGAIVVEVVGVPVCAKAGADTARAAIKARSDEVFIGRSIGSISLPLRHDRTMRLCG